MAKAEVHLDPTLWPDEYVMEVVGDCLHPLISEGDAILHTKAETPVAGDFVVVWFRSDSTKSNYPNSMVKQLALNLPPALHRANSQVRGALCLRQLNPPEQFWVDTRHVIAVHKAIGHVPKDLVKPDSIDLQDVQPMPKPSPLPIVIDGPAPPRRGRAGAYSGPGAAE